VVTNNTVISNSLINLSDIMDVYALTRKGSVCSFFCCGAAVYSSSSDAIFHHSLCGEGTTFI